MKKLSLLLLCLILSSASFAQSKKAKKLYDKAYKAAQDGYAVEASVHLTDAIVRYKDYAEAYELRALCFLAMNQQEQAAKDFEKAVEINPKMMRSLANLIDINEKAENWAKVAKYAEIIYDHHPPYKCAALFDWGSALEKDGKTDQAIEKYKSFLSMDCEEMKDESMKVEQSLRLLRN
ncbi:MAG: tetratricopeptide repeat protein [Bacteroidota bacterium]